MELINNYNKFITDLKSKINTNNEIIFFCIGTDRVIGDCIGPITGSILKRKINSNYVYGDLEENLTFDNITEKIDEVESKFNNPYIIAIDAALSTEQNIGKIFIDYSGISIGQGLNKNKKSIGNIGIKVVVGKNRNDIDLNFKTLQNISLNQVIYFSKKISDGILYALNK